MPRVVECTPKGEAIAEERDHKVATLWHERQSPMVAGINGLVERGLGEGLDSDKGASGPQLVIRGMRSGHGMSVGISYRQSDLWREHVRYPATARGTLQGAYMLDFTLDFQGPRTERTFMRWYTKFEDSPGIDYYDGGAATTHRARIRHSVLGCGLTRLQDRSQARGTVRCAVSRVLRRRPEGVRLSASDSSGRTRCQ